jgi:hypothetical protein
MHPPKTAGRRRGSVSPSRLGIAAPLPQITYSMHDTSMISSYVGIIVAVH